MPDITMCSGIGCPLRKNCFRHRATPNGDRQSWFGTVPYVDGVCAYFATIYHPEMPNSERVCPLREPTP